MLRAVMERPEKPERLIGSRVAFDRPDGLGSDTPIPPNALITSYQAGAYVAEFELPYDVAGHTSRTASLRARHVGHPLSGARRHGFLAVAVQLESGFGFVTSVKRVG